MKTINEVYELIKQKRDNAKIELNKVYGLANDFLNRFDIKSGVDMFIKNSRLVGEVNAYAYAVALIEESGVLEELAIYKQALELACVNVNCMDCCWFNCRKEPYNEKHNCIECGELGLTQKHLSKYFLDMAKKGETIC